MISCTHKSENCESADVVSLYSFYNASIWAPLIKDRQCTDVQLKESLLKTSYVFREFANYLITSSGGFRPEHELFNPCWEIKDGDEKLDAFYADIRLLLREIETLDRETQAFNELYAIVKYNLLDEDGPLPKSKLPSLSVGQVAPRLLVLENFCFYLVVKYC